jgi:hypothetical protein
VESDARLQRLDEVNKEINRAYAEAIEVRDKALKALKDRYTSDVKEAEAIFDIECNRREEDSGRYYLDRESVLADIRKENAKAKRAATKARKALSCP